MTTHIDTLRQSLARAAFDHRSGHTCTHGVWHNPNAGATGPCPTLRAIDAARDAGLALHGAVHAAAHDDTTATRVAEAMTGFTLADIPDEEAAGWLLTARLAIEALAVELDRDHDREARAAAARDRLTTRQETP